MKLGVKASYDKSIEREEVEVEEPKPCSDTKTLEEVERDHILKTFEFYNRHRIKTAKALGISISKLYRKLLAYGETIKEGVEI